MKKILVPCDFSQLSQQALLFALEMANAANSEVAMIHVVELPIMHNSILMPTLNFEEALIHESKSVAEKKFQEWKEQYGKEKVITSEVVFGPIRDTIADYIEENNIDMIVMGSHGASGIQEVFIGSNAEKIVRTSPVPVIIVKSPIQFKTIKNIVLPFNPNWKPEQVIEKAISFQQMFQATLHIVYINTPINFRSDADIIPAIESFARDGKIHNFTVSVYNDLNEVDGICRFVKVKQADMVLMATHGRRGLNHLISGSIAEDVVNHIDYLICTFRLK